AGLLPQVSVDVLRAEGMALAVPVDELEQLLAREVTAAPHDAREPPVPEIDGVRLAALAAEREVQLRARDLDMLAAQRGEPEGAVLAGILLVADADEGGLEQPDQG